MELREEEVVAHYEAAVAMLEGFDHTPRIARGAEKPQVERSSGIGTRRRFRSTTPGLVTRSTARPEGVRLLERIEASDGGDVLVSPVQATVLQGLRRAIAIALAVGDAFGEATGLKALKKDNLGGRLPEAQKTEFAELLQAEALVVLYTFGNAVAYLLASTASEVTAYAFTRSA